MPAPESDDREEHIADLSRGRSLSGREERADFLEDERIRRARELAYQQGKRDADVDGRLDSHERRLNSINGSLAATATELRGVKEGLSSMKSAMATNEAIEEALVKVADRTGARRFTRLQSVGIFVLGATAVGAFVLSILAALGHP